jgi:hypothetical protein
MQMDVAANWTGWALALAIMVVVLAKKIRGNDAIS